MLQSRNLDTSQNGNPDVESPPTGLFSSEDRSPDVESPPTGLFSSEDRSPDVQYPPTDPWSTWIRNPELESTPPTGLSLIENLVPPTTAGLFGPPDRAFFSDSSRVDASYSVFVDNSAVSRVAVVQHQETSVIRNLVLCFDGTTNKFGAKRITNVVRMFELLQKDDEHQFCYYQPGIGTYDAQLVPLQEHSTSLSSKISRSLNAASANDIPKHILGGYKFLMSHYHSNDRIYMFGFSRGAYTARALCGMLEKVGLLSVGNDEQVEFAWQMHKQKGNDPLAAKFCTVFCQDVRVHFLGLWDTVKSTKQNFPDPQTKSFVSFVYHALALDERRVHFLPRYYREPTQPPRNRPTRSQDDKLTSPKVSDLPTQIFERWFVGDHADVGGRFKFGELDKDALANPSFRWIVWAAARAAGDQPLLFNLPALLTYFPILIYKNWAAEEALNRTADREMSFNADYLAKATPEEDSQEAVTDDSPGGRPASEVRSMLQPVNNAFKAPSVWVPAQLWRGRGSRGSARIIDENPFLHASVRGKLAADENYGGKRREKLMLCVADEICVSGK